MGIIDCRYRPPTHDWLEGIIENPVYAEYARRRDLEKMPPLELHEAVEILKSAGVSKAVLVGRDIETSWNSSSSNRLVDRDFAAYPDFFIPVYGVDPGKGMSGYKMLKKALLSGDAFGIAIEPGMARCPVNDRLYYPYYALCCDLEVPVIITAGLAPNLRGVKLDAASPCRLDCVATDFPELKMLVSHGCYPFVNEMLGICARHENIFMDLSSTFKKPLAEEYIKAATGFLSDRFVFASASPFADFITALRQAQSIEFESESRQNFFENNAIRLFARFPV